MREACRWGDGKGAFESPAHPELNAVQQAEFDRYTTLALDALKAAIEAGWDDFAHMQRDSDLATLHNLPDFKALVSE